MKQKYTITVAGIELNVIADGTEDKVESVVAGLDRKMREICLASPRCSKNEAALLCALDFCSENMAREEHLSELEETVQKNTARIAALEAENRALTEKAEKLKQENDVLTGVLSRAAQTTDTAESAEKSDAPHAKAAKSGEVPEQISAEIAEPKPEGKGKRNRVGNMFDLLTFHDDV